ncbi:MAG: L-aspartate oxidase [Thermoplasmata archaeon]
MAELQGRPLIVGSGIAGLYVSLRSEELGLHPTLVTKASLEESNTRYAQGGIAAAIGPDDAVALHLKDTVRAGDGLVNARAARVLVEEAPRRIADLVRFGVPFDTLEGQVALGREAAHSRARILHAGGDATGLRIEETLRERVIAAGIEIRERAALRRIFARPGGGWEAELAVEGSRGVVRLSCSELVLATGGAGNLYRESSNPAVAMGEGVSVAARAGALLADMEFVQFHPTVFYREGAPRFLITEALRGEGAHLVNVRGDAFMKRYHPLGDLAPRDVVTRAIRTEMERTEQPSVSLDATHLPRDRLASRFPTVFRFLGGYALDPSRDLIPVAPAAHFTIGGISTDLEGRSSLPGLLACGEVAAPGVHGANRLGSNSLLEGVVFGEHVARQLLNPAPGGPTMPGAEVTIPAPQGHGGPIPEGAPGEIRSILWEEVGIVRSAVGLTRALRRLHALQNTIEPVDGKTAPPALGHAVFTAALIAHAALAREESRGAHYRADFPRPRSVWRRHLGLRVTPPA